MTAMSYVKVAKVSDIAPETSLKAEIGGRSVLLCHSKGKFQAVANRCSHADEALECGRVRNGWISCPAHGARFELSTGRAMNPPATSPIEIFPTRVTGEWIEVALSH